MSVDAVIKLVLHYVDQLVQLITGPRLYFRERVASAEKALTGAVTFLLFSIVIAFIMRLPFGVGEGDVWRQLPIMLIFYGLTAGVLGSLACLAMRVLGGKASLVGHLVVFSHFAGLSVIVFTLSTVIAKAVIRAGEAGISALQENYVAAVLAGSRDVDAPRFASVADSTEVTYAMLILLLGQVVIAVWLVVCWRSMAEINGLSRLKGYLALGLFLVAGYAVASVAGTVQLGAGLALF